MASLLERTLGAVRKENTGGQGQGNRRVSGGAQARGSPYARPDGGSWKHDRFGETEEGSDSARGKGGRSAAAFNSAEAGQGHGPSPKLVISNLHYEVSERELEVLFVQIGPIAAGPKIKFDRSGRSEGIAWVTYSSEKDAAAAKEAFDGAFAKGEPIKVDFDYRIDRALERGAPAAGSLLARVGAPVDGGNTRGPKFASPTGGRGTGPRHSAGGSSGRSERGVGSSGAPRGGRDSRDAGGRGSDARGGGGRGGRGGAGGRGGERFKAQPKSGGDLDAELEAFMKAPSGGSSAKPAAAPAAAAAAPEATTGGDVEMA
ncbi:hypothetical protein JCM10908_005527 [Rhodotorula pacifica]|uniref:uncharacterized protein n=1 Tax=Rhodotorula pacifica TaxID=1495444 RepID=UPI003178FACA